MNRIRKYILSFRRPHIFVVHVGQVVMINGRAYRVGEHHLFLLTIRSNHD